MTAWVGPDRSGARAPLAAWIWAASFTALFVTAFLLSAGRIEVPESEAFLQFNRSRLDRFAAAEHEGALRIIMVGNSRLKYATPPDTEFSALAEASALGPARFLRIMNNWAVFEDFQGLADRMLAARPDVIVLQLELLGQERAKPARSLLFREYVRWRLGARGPWNPGGIDQHDLQYGTPCADDGIDPPRLWERKRRAERWLAFDASGRSARFAREFIGRAVAQGIHVALLQIAKTEAIEGILPSADPVVMEEGRRLEAASSKIKLIRHPGAVPDRFYCDFVHMNEKGRAAFSAWLLGELAGFAAPAKPPRDAAGS